MNKRLLPWYIGVLVALALSVVVGTYAFFYTSIMRVEAMTLTELLCSGVWLPLFAGFIGCCIRIKKKWHFAIPIAVGIPLVFGVIGYIRARWISGSGWLAALGNLGHSLFYFFLCAASFITFIAALIHAIVIWKKGREEFRRKPAQLFEGRSALLLIPLVVLTVVCAIPAVCGYIESIR